jgi:hypothetical protein
MMCWAREARLLCSVRHPSGTNQRWELYLGLASSPANILNQTPPDLGIPLRFNSSESGSKRIVRTKKSAVTHDGRAGRGLRCSRIFCPPKRCALLPPALPKEGIDS